MTKAELNMLEKLFSAEIEHAMGKSTLPFCFQSKAKILEKLADENMVEKIEIELGGRCPMIIRGWVLTHYGRMTYCENC